MSVVIPIGANASAAVAAFDDVREAIRRSGQEAKAFRDLDLSHPELAGFAGDLATVRQQLDDLTRVSRGATATAARHVYGGPNGLNPFAPEADQDDEWERRFPDPSERNRVRSRAEGYINRGTIFGPPPPPPPLNASPPGAPPGPGGSGPTPAPAPAPAGPGPGDGVFSGLMGMLKGPAGVLLGLSGLGHIASMASQGFGHAVEESASNDQLLRRGSDASTDFDKLRDSVRKAADGVGLLYPQAQKMALTWERIVGYGNTDTVAGHVRTAAEMGRGFGIDADSMGALSAKSDKAGLSQRDFAKLIAEASSDGKMTGAVEDVAASIQRWAETSNRTGVGANSSAEFAKLFASMTGGDNKGLRANAEGFIQQMDATIKAGGGGGRASEALTYRAFAANGERNPFTIRRLQEKGMLGHVHSDGSGPTIYDAVREQILKQYPGGSADELERQDHAMGVHFGTGAEVQRQIRLNMPRGGMGQMSKLIKDAGLDESKIDFSSYAELGKLSRSDADLPGMRDKMLTAGSGYTVSDEQRRKLQAASGEELRNELARTLAGGGGQRTEATRHQDATAKLANEITTAMGKLLPVVDAISGTAGKILESINKIVDWVAKKGEAALTRTAPPPGEPTQNDLVNTGIATLTAYHPGGGGGGFFGRSGGFGGGGFVGRAGGFGGGSGRMGGGSSGYAGRPPEAQERGMMQQAYDQLTKELGWAPEDATALIAQFHEESGFNLGSEGDRNIPGGSGGIGQWNRERRQNFRQMFGHDVAGAPLREQVAFADWEMNHTHTGARDEMRAARGVRAKSDALLRRYEAPSLANQQARSGGNTAAGLLDPLTRGAYRGTNLPGDMNRLPVPNPGEGHGLTGGAHVFQTIAPLRVIHEDRHGNELHRQNLPVQAVVAPTPYGRETPPMLDSRRGSAEWYPRQGQPTPPVSPARRQRFDT